MLVPISAAILPMLLRSAQATFGRLRVLGSILSFLSYTEFESLLICLSLDIVEYVIPVLMLPLIGDVFDFVGIAVCLYLFRALGLVSLLELIPGLDILPINSVAWFIWLILKRQREAAAKNLSRSRY
jgi:hypothetical protein